MIEEKDDAMSGVNEPKHHENVEDGKMIMIVIPLPIM
jgi:hypothetical protein